jgi:DNA-binding transcriptional MerR regulator
MAQPAAGRAENPVRLRSGGRAAKSATAFRTISEVAGELDVAQHVLRFWESKFPQVRPLKRGGGRRYYRPEDVDLLRQIRSLLYDEGYTIKGAQKLLRGQRRPLGAEAGDGGHEDEDDDGIRQGALANPDVTPAMALPPDTRRRLVLLRDELVMLREMLREAAE